jgi:hemolysin-activating ACP:hemolysin acyltransferase
MKQPETPQMTPSTANRPDIPSSEEFTRALGQISWLMTMSKRHRQLKVEWMEAHIIAPLAFKQVRVLLKEKRPVAAVIWAYASKSVAEKIAGGEYDIKLEDWRSGQEVIVVECISPFGHEQRFIDTFLAEVAKAKRHSVQ